MNTVCKSKTGLHPDDGKPVVLVEFTYSDNTKEVIAGIGDTQQQAIENAIERSNTIDARPLSSDEIWFPKQL